MEICVHFLYSSFSENTLKDETCVRSTNLDHDMSLCTYLMEHEKTSKRQKQHIKINFYDQICTIGYT